MKNNGEFGFIEGIREMFASMSDNGFEGIGDDCAVLPIGNDEALVFTSDMLNEDIHFRYDISTPYQIGYKSLMVNVSDVAAMGAKPVATLLSLSLPEECFGKWAEEFMKGYHAASEKYGVKLVGGDTTASVNDIAINVTAIGRAPLANIKRRSAAKVDDLIVVTGKLGASTVGLRDLLAGRTDTENAKIHLAPEARVEEGQWLAQHEDVHAMMDISDGISSDLLHILNESQVSAIVPERYVPVAKGAVLYDATDGGEDYELLFTVGGRNIQQLMGDFEAKFGKPLYIIGSIIESEDGKHTLGWECEGGIRYDEEAGGYRHFRYTNQEL